jgi:hypothetical protein
MRFYNTLDFILILFLLPVSRQPATASGHVMKTCPLRNVCIETYFVLAPVANMSSKNNYAYHHANGGNGYPKGDVVVGHDNGGGCCRDDKWSKFFSMSV